MNIVFMGTPDFALFSLEKIYEAGHNVLAVISQMDKPSGRGMKLTKTPTKVFAEENNIKVFQPEKVKRNEDFINEIKKLNPDVIVVVAYGKILPKEILEIPKYGCINVHGSLLPKYRGAAPIQWAVINGEEKTGITTMYMAEGMDTGDMILKGEVKVEDEDDFGTVYEKLKVLGGNLIVETLEKVADGTAPRKKQDDNFTLAPMINKEDCKIDWKKSAKDIRNLIRGLNPIPGAYTILDNKMIKVLEAEILDENSLEQAGTVILSNDKIGLFVTTGDKVLNLKVIQAPNAKRMNTLDYLRGNNIVVGSKFI